MPNPIYNILNQQNMQNPMQVMMQKFNEFRNNFKGNPQEEVQKLLNSGQMSQQQYNQLQNMATQFQQMLGGMGR